MVAALEAAIERGAEVACLQEPYVGKKHTISHPGFQIRWPECVKRDTRVALAIRNNALDRYVFEERTRRETTCGANQGRRRRSSHHMASKQH